MTRYVVRLTMPERNQLLRLIHIVEASEWDAGDYNLTQRQFDTLQSVKTKLDPKP